MKRLVLPLLLLLSACSGGPDPIRYKAERSSWELAVRCADGWFLGLPVTEGDKALVTRSLDAWGQRLDVDAAALGVK